MDTKYDVSKNEFVLSKYNKDTIKNLQDGKNLNKESKRVETYADIVRKGLWSWGSPTKEIN